MSRVWYLLCTFFRVVGRAPVQDCSCCALQGGTSVHLWPAQTWAKGPASENPPLLALLKLVGALRCSRAELLPCLPCPALPALVGPSSGFCAGSMTFRAVGVGTTSGQSAVGGTPEKVEGLGSQRQKLPGKAGYAPPPQTSAVCCGPVQNGADKMSVGVRRYAPWADRSGLLCAPCLGWSSTSPHVGNGATHTQR